MLLVLNVSICIAWSGMIHVHVCSPKDASQSQLLQAAELGQPCQTVPVGKIVKGICKQSNQQKGVTKINLLWACGQDGPFPTSTSNTSVAQVWPNLTTQYEYAKRRITQNPPNRMYIHLTFFSRSLKINHITMAKYAFTLEQGVVTNSSFTSCR